MSDQIKDLTYLGINLTEAAREHSTEKIQEDIIVVTQILDSLVPLNS
jgi:hypothetical protein